MNANLFTFFIFGITEDTSEKLELTDKT